MVTQPKPKSGKMENWSSNGFNYNHSSKTLGNSGIDGNSDYFSYSYYLCFVVSLRSNNLTHLQKYSKRQECLFNFIQYLHDEKGMGYRKISQFLNKSGIKTQRNKTFSNSSVHSILKRKKQREERIEKVRNKRYESSMGKMTLEFLRD